MTAGCYETHKPGANLVGLIDQFSPIVPMVWRDRLAPGDPYLPELRTRFGDRVIDGLTLAAPPPRRDEDDDVDWDGARPAVTRSTATQISTTWTTSAAWAAFERSPLRACGNALSAQ